MMLLPLDYYYEILETDRYFIQYSTYLYPVYTELYYKLVLNLQPHQATHSIFFYAQLSSSEHDMVL